MKYLFICYVALSIMMIYFTIGDTNRQLGIALESVEQLAYCNDNNARLHDELHFAMEQALAKHPDKQEDDFMLEFVPFR